MSLPENTQKRQVYLYTFFSTSCLIISYNTNEMLINFTSLTLRGRHFYLISLTNHYLPSSIHPAE